MRLILLLIASVLTGCIIPSSNIAVAPGASLQSIQRVVVWKFVDGEVRNSGDAATRAFEAALMRQGVAVIPVARVRNTLAVEIGFGDNSSIDAGMLTPAVLSKIRQQSGADALILGSVGLSLSSPKYAPSNFIEVNFQIVDTRSGALIASGSSSGEAWSMQQAASNAVTKIIRSFKP